MLKTAIYELFSIERPIIQGGMAYIATAELASAVSNAGGLGSIIGADAADSDWVRQQIRLTRQRTDKPFGVNVIMLSHHIQKVVEVMDEVVSEAERIISLLGKLRRNVCD